MSTPGNPSKLDEMNAPELNPDAIVSLKQAAQSLQQQADLGRLALDETGVGVWAYDLKSQHVHYSEEWLRMLGEKEVKPDIDALLNRIHPEDLASCQQNLGALLQGNCEQSKKEHRMRHTAGHDIWVQTAAKVAAHDQQGQVALIVGTQIDISRLKQKELEQETTLLELGRTTDLLEMSGRMTRTGWWWVDLESQSIHWSPMTREIHEVDLNYQPDLASGINFYVGESQTRVSQALEKTMATGIPFNGEFKIKTARGNIRWVRVFCEVERQAEKAVKIFGSFQDITLLQQTQRELKQVNRALQEKSFLLNTSSKMTRTGWWLVDHQNNQRIWSDVTREIREVPVDFKPTPENTVQFFKQTADYERALRAFQQAIETGQQINLEHEEVTFKGNQRWVRTVGETEYKNGKPFRTLGAIQDITDYKRNEHSLREAKHQAEAANRTKSEFLTTMSHEIRTPLHGVIGFNELLQHTDLNGTQQEYIKASTQSATTLMELLNDILDYSKLEAGQMALEPEKLDLAKWLQAINDSFTPRAQAKNLAFVLDVAEDLPASIWVDRKALTKILNVLLHNALKFTSHGKIELTVNWTNQEQLRFSILDTGIGIASENQEKIFDLFTQADGSSTRQHQGSGLGLTICSRLLKLMHSQLKIESKIKHGSIFTFELTLAHEGQFKGFTNTASPVFKRVLLVDDNANNRHILAGMFALLNIESVACLSGQEALSRLQTETFDLAVIDHEMPDMDGMELIEKIRCQAGYTAEQLPIILLHSSSGQVAITRKCQEFDVNLEVIKPITFSQLQALLKQLPNESPPKQDLPANAAAQILIVDDNEINRLLASNLVTTLLPQAGISEAENGQEALAVYAQKPINLILLDLHMPIKNGFDTAREIRAQYPDRQTPIVAITAAPEADNKTLCLEAGMNPFWQSQLIQKT